jgi:hypothetical protein
MKSFLREYWPWIVLPIALVFGALVLAYLLVDDGGASPFQYDLSGGGK